MRAGRACQVCCYRLERDADSGRLIERWLENVAEVPLAPEPEQALASPELHEGPKAALLVEHAFVDELAERLGSRSRVDAEGRGVLRGRHDLLFLHEVPFDDVLTDLIGDLTVDRVTAVEHGLASLISRRRRGVIGAWVH